MKCYQVVPPLLPAVSPDDQSVSDKIPAGSTLPIWEEEQIYTNAMFIHPICPDFREKVLLSFVGLGDANFAVTFG